MMFNKLFLMFLPMAACATGLPKVDDNTFYHQTGARPTITEIPNDAGRLVTIHNPFGKTLTIQVDCAEELKKRTFVIPASSDVSFTTISNEEFFDMACTIEHGWTIK